MYKDYYGYPEIHRSVTVLYAGREQCAPGHSWEGVRDHHLVHYVISGRGYAWISGRPVALEAGGCFFFGPSDRLRYQADWNQPWTYAWIGFTGRDAPALMREYLDASRSPVIQLPVNNGTVNLITAIFEALKRRATGSATQASGLLQAVVGSLITDVSERLHGPVLQTDYVAAAASFMDLNFQRNIRVRDVATRIGIDRSHLSRLFRATRGITIRDYLIERRMRRAKELLEQTTLPIRAVASSVGYDNYVAFERRFAANARMSPTA